MTDFNSSNHCSDGAAVMRFNSPAASGSAAAFSLSVFNIWVLSVLASLIALMSAPVAKLSSMGVGVSSGGFGCSDSAMDGAPVIYLRAG